MFNSNDMLRQIIDASAKEPGHGPRVLWSGGYYMSGTQTANLSEPVSAQQSGIVLVWSSYSGGALNQQFSSFFVPKQLVELMPGCGHDMSMLPSATTIGAMAKYVYVHDDHITGHANNSTSFTNTAADVKVANASWVLRYVFGV